MPYIYKITNKINGKLYIGKTSLSKIEERMAQHIRDSRKIRCEKRPLYDAFNKYGIENFVIEEIEKVDNDEIACERERYWINKLRTYVGFEDSTGYNATLGGDSRRLYDYTELANAYLLFGTVKKVCEQYNCDPSVVRHACVENNVSIQQFVSKNKKRIQRIDKDGNIKIYSSITEAAKDFTNKEIETARKNISRGLNKNKPAYGYTWISI